MDTASVTAAPIELNIDGEIYRVALLTDEVLGRLERFVQDRHVDSVKRHIVGLDPDVAGRVLSDATRDASRLRIGTPEFSEVLLDPSVMIRIVTMLIQKHHPKINDQMVRGWFFVGHAEALSDAMTRSMEGGVLGKLMQAQTASTAPSMPPPSSEMNCTPASP